MTRERIHPKGLYPAFGAYQHVVKVAGCKTLVFVAGQNGVDLQERLVGVGEAEGSVRAAGVSTLDLEAQVRQTWVNVGECLKAAGAHFKDVIRMNTYVVDLAFNEYRSLGPGIRREWVGEYPVPDATVAVRALMPPNALIEIDAIAALEEELPPARFDPATVHKPLGPYQHIIRVPSDTLVFVAGQVGVDRGGSMAGAPKPGDQQRAKGLRSIAFEPQLRQAFENLKVCLNAAGADVKDVVRLTSYVVPEAFNEYRGAMRLVRRDYFGDHRPAATSLCVGGLMPPDALIELEAMAALVS